MEMSTILELALLAKAFLQKLDDINAKLDAISRQVTESETKTMSAIDDLAASVAAEDTVIASAVTLLQGLSAALTAAGTDPVKLAALKSDVDAQTTALAAAVAANPVPAA